MSILRRIFETLREHYERRPPMPWWPDEPVEVVVGAVLVQGATWKSVSGVLEILRSKNLLDFKRIAETEPEELASLIRPVGFQTKKAGRLREIAQLFLNRSGGDPVAFFARDPDLVRKELLSVSGIGPGTADNILLYAGKHPIYMVDPFTTRLLVRHGIVARQAKENEIQHLVHQELTPDEEPYGAQLFCDFQALVVRLGRDFCDKSSPDCDACPLAGFLPEGGAVGVEDKPTATVAVRKVKPPATAEKPLPKPVEGLPLNENERKIVELLAGEPVSIDSVVQQSGLPVHLVRATIAILEMRKIVRQVEGNKVRRV